MHTPAYNSLFSKCPDCFENTFNERVGLCARLGCREQRRARQGLRGDPAAEAAGVVGADCDA
jgi:hypothetical protein